MRIVRVNLGDRGYDIKVAPGLLTNLGKECARLAAARRCALITDSNVGPLYAAAAGESLRREGFEPIVITVPAGEKSKSLRTVERCYQAAAAQHLERGSLVIALGGGVVGDLAGFVAATYLRGLPFVQVPTTLLAQVDSSVGGKVGVNLRAGKNLVGAFHQPRLVLCDLDVFATLPEREYRAGLAEVIKYGVIADRPFFERLERSLPSVLRRTPAALSAIVARCCELKAQVVAEDETEGGLRAILNFGHTVGHAFEAVSHYGKYLHGEAISIGQAAAARLSSRFLGLPEAEAERITSLLAAAGLPIAVRTTRPQRASLLAAMRLDKKVSGGEIKFVLARRIGRVDFGCKVPLEAIEDVLKFGTPTPNR